MTTLKRRVVRDDDPAATGGIGRGEVDQERPKAPNEFPSRGGAYVPLGNRPCSWRELRAATVELVAEFVRQ